jgi:hypothetical protein
MAQENIVPEMVQKFETRQNSFTKVTPLSKNLALVLFVTLPFVGFWLGYKYAPEKVIEVEEVAVEDISYSSSSQSVSGQSRVETYKGEIIASSSSASQAVYIEEYMCDSVESYEQSCYRLMRKNEDSQQQVVIKDLSLLYQTQFNTKSKFDNYIFKDANSNTIFFKSFIPGSSACCGVVKYELGTLDFKEQKNGYCASCGELMSPTGQYIARVESGDMETIEIIDILLDEVIKEIKIGRNETVSTPCSYGGGYDFKWLEDTTLEYGVFEQYSLDESDCEYNLIEKRQIIIL